MFKNLKLVLILVSSFCFSVECPSFQTSLPLIKEVFVDVKGAKLFCRVMGQGNPVIVLHGGPGLSQDYFLPQMAKIAEQNLVIFYDQRGSGSSTGSINPETINIETFVSDLEALRHFFGFEKFTLIGHSWGGFLAMKYAITHPEAINKLVLISSMGPSYEDLAVFGKEFERRTAPIQNQMKKIEGTHDFSLGVPKVLNGYFTIIFSTYCYDPLKAKELNLCMSKEANLNWMKVSGLFDQNLMSKPFNIYPRLKNLKVPTFIIHGDHDPIPVSVAINIHTTIDPSKLYIIENCGHFPYIERPDKFFGIMFEILKFQPITESVP